MSKYKHSRSYHRFFENYAELETPSPGGGHTIRRVYVGNYYKVGLSDSEHRRRRIGILLLSLTAAAAYLLGAFTAEVSAVSLAALATMPPLIALLFWVPSVFSRVTAPREMEIRTYRDSSESLLRSSMAFLVCMGVCIAVTLFVCLQLSVLPQSISSLLFYLVAAGAGFAVYLLEKNTNYETLPPRQERPAQSSPVRYEMPE